MPFVSDSQRRWMFSQEPEMAKRWAKHTPKGKKLPEKKGKPVDKKAFCAGFAQFAQEKQAARGDGTGPLGAGPMTGRGAGYCAGNDTPGYMNPFPGRKAKPDEKKKEKNKEKSVDKKAFVAGMSKFFKESGVDPFFMFKRPGERYLTGDRQDAAADKKIKRLQKEKEKRRGYSNESPKEESKDKKAFWAGFNKYTQEKQALMPGSGKGLPMLAAALAGSFPVMGAAVGAPIGAVGGALTNPGDRLGGAVRKGSEGAGVGAGAGAGLIAGGMGGMALGEKLFRANSRARELAEIIGIFAGIAGGGRIGGYAGKAVGEKLAPPKEEPKKAGFEYGLEVFCRQNGLDKATLAKMAEVDDVVAYLQSAVNA